MHASELHLMVPRENVRRTLCSCEHPNRSASTFEGIWLRFISTTTPCHLNYHHQVKCEPSPQPHSDMPLEQTRRSLKLCLPVIKTGSLLLTSLAASGSSVAQYTAARRPFLVPTTFQRQGVGTQLWANPSLGLCQRNMQSDTKSLYLFEAKTPHSANEAVMLKQED